MAAIEAAERGESVIVVDEGPEVGGSLLADRGGSRRPASCRSVPAQPESSCSRPRSRSASSSRTSSRSRVGNTLLKIRAQRVVVAAGVVEQPLVFPGNDLIGVMLPEGVRRLVNYWSIKPGTRAVVLTADDRGLAAAADLESAGVEIAELVDFRKRQPPNIEAAGRRGRVDQVGIHGQWIACDLVVMSGSPQPNYKLLAQAGARVEYDTARGIFVPTDLPAHVEAVGAAAGDVGEPAVPAPVLGHRGEKCFVCFCEDQTTKDLKYAIAEGFDSIELSKRYTTVTMGPCQGRLCHVNSIRVYAKANGVDENTIGTTTARPPYAPVSMGLVASRPQEPAKRTSLHHRHKDLGGKMMWTGAWRRPHSYSDDPGEEAQHVHQALGLIDVSTLGQAPRQRAGSRRLPRPALPEPLLRPQGRSHPLRRTDHGRGSDHGRRHGRPARRRHLLCDDDVDGRRRRLPVVHVVERRLAHGCRAREPDRGARRCERRRPARTRR